MIGGIKSVPVLYGENAALRLVGVLLFVGSTILTLSVVGFNTSSPGVLTATTVLTLVWSGYVGYKVTRKREYLELFRRLTQLAFVCIIIGILLGK